MILMLGLWLGASGAWAQSEEQKEAKGQSVYLCPSIGVGTDRPTEGSIEIGYKWVGW